MATLVHPLRHGPTTVRARGLPHWTIPVAVAVAVAARIPFIGHVLGPDEAGFLIVGRQWDGAGTSLYGNYWVDRPPMLITIFRIAGGATELRLIGCLAVAALVLGCARVAGLIGGVQASRWAAVAVTALSISLGGYEVNGELLAAPFIVAGFAAAICAVRAVGTRRAATLAGLAGALAMCALLIKQNFVDVAVFAAAAFVIAGVRGEISRRRLLHLTAGSAAGAAAVLVGIGGWTVLHGTSLGGVFDAMYPFRIKAGHVMAVGGRPYAMLRLHGLLLTALRSGLAIVLLVVVFRVASRRRPTDTVWWALLVTICFGVVSVFLGGNYWTHYLIEVIGPAAIAIGVLAGRRGRASQLLVVYVAVAAVLAGGLAMTAPQGRSAERVGEAVASSAHPGDTIFAAYGRPNVVEASGLSSPYPYLWSLPLKTLDPHLTALNAVLVSPAAPTYFVTWKGITSWGLDSAATQELVARDYRPLATVCGHTIYLHKGVSRIAPPPPTSCRSTSPEFSSLKEYIP